MKKLFYGLVLLLIVAGIGYYAYGKRTQKVQAPTEQAQQQPTNQNTQVESKPEIKVTTSTPSTTSPSTSQPKKQAPAPAVGTFSSGEEGNAPDIAVVEVVYDGTKFTPSTVNIKVGDYVIFRNKSTKDFWPASAPHPTHTDYPAFDPKQVIATGGKWQFEFMKAGSWKYHDHLNPSASGTVNVSAR